MLGHQIGMLAQPVTCKRNVSAIPQEVDGLALFGGDDQRCWGGPCPRRQFCEAAVRPVIDELGQHVAQVGFGIDAVQLAGLDQRGEHRPVFRPFVAAGKQSILSVQSNRSHAALGGIGVDLDAAVVKEAHQPIPMGKAISDGLGNR